MTQIRICVGRIEYQLQLTYPDTGKYFSDFIVATGLPNPEPCSEPCSEPFSFGNISKEDITREMIRLKSGPSFAEYSLLIEDFSDLVIHQQRFLFHGAAFMWNDGAYLFTGKSGIGKTTQLSNWMSLYPQETKIINGDKPLIAIEESNLIVYPCPWTGKERWSGQVSGPLKGIILLEQGKDNNLAPMEISEAVFPIFLQFLYKPDSVINVDLICGYAETLLRSIPIWKLVNDGSAASTRLVHDRLMEVL